MKAPGNSPIAPTAVDAVDNASLRQAILDACQIHPSKITLSALGAIDKAVRDLKAVGATPGEVPAAANNFRARFPTATLTPPALAKHWPQLVSTSVAASATAAERFGFALANRMIDPDEAMDEIHNQLDEPDRTAACRAFNEARQRQLEAV
jgi:hypothetical protein